MSLPRVVVTLPLRCVPLVERLIPFLSIIKILMLSLMMVTSVVGPLMLAFTISEVAPVSGLTAECRSLSPLTLLVLVCMIMLSLVPGSK